MAEWFEEGIEADHLAEIAAKGWNKPLTPEVAREIATAHRAATKMLGVPADQILRLPKDAADPLYQIAFDRVVGMSVPKTADEYKFDGIKAKDGSALATEDEAFIRDYATRNKLSLPAARDLAAQVVARKDASTEATAGQSAVARQANENALTLVWGADADRNKFAASQAVDAMRAMGIPAPPLDGLASAEYVAAMNGLVKLNGLNAEAAMHRGGGAPVRNNFAGMSREDAHAKFAELRENSEWFNKALRLGTEEATYLANLQSVMAGVPIR